MINPIGGNYIAANEERLYKILNTTYNTIIKWKKQKPKFLLCQEDHHIGELEVSIHQTNTEGSSNQQIGSVRGDYVCGHYFSTGRKFFLKKQTLFFLVPPPK